MSDSSSDENEGTPILYRDNPEWKDVVPVPQNEEDGIVIIDYSVAFRDVYDYFRAVLQTGEKSERVLKLTHDAINLNPANYTVWQYRRDTLQALNKDINEELRYISSFIRYNSKNYQVWHHRRILIEWLQDASKEKEFTAFILMKENKNYHAWQHRQWAIKTFDLFDGELEFVEELISVDIRNNSAWNQRYFILNNKTDFNADVLDKEIDYVLKQIKIDVENESSWNYLKGILLHHENGLGGSNQVTTFCEELYSSGNRSSFLLGFIVDLCYENATAKSKNERYNLERGKQICEELASKHDVIRAKYWRYMSVNLEKKFL